MQKTLAVVLVGLAFFSLAFAQGVPECPDFGMVKHAFTIVPTLPYAGRVVVQREGSATRIGIPWQKVQGHGVVALEIVPVRGPDVGQPFAYTDSDFCADRQVKFFKFDGRLFWITVPKWMMNGGCYEALIYRFGLADSIERRQYSFCYNP